MVMFHVCEGGGCCKVLLFSVRRSDDDAGSRGIRTEPYYSLASFHYEPNARVLAWSFVQFISFLFIVTMITSKNPPVTRNFLSQSLLFQF